jgi:hypothetical protein
MAACRRGGVPYSQLTNGSNPLEQRTFTSVYENSVGHGVPYWFAYQHNLEPAHCHIPLCVWATDLYFGVCKWIQRALRKVFAKRKKSWQNAESSCTPSTVC